MARLTDHLNMTIAVDRDVKPQTKQTKPTSFKQIQAHFKYCQVKNHFQSSHEPHDLNMDFCSFDSDFKQLWV